MVPFSPRWRRRYRFQWLARGRTCLALRAARSALDDAGITAADVDLLVHVTSTPDMVSCQDHFRFLTTGLGLRRDASLVHTTISAAPDWRPASAQPPRR